MRRCGLVEEELGLRKGVVRFHRGRGERERVYAVGGGFLGEREGEAGPGAVGEEEGVGRVVGYSVAEGAVRLEISVSVWEGSMDRGEGGRRGWVGMVVMRRRWGGSRGSKAREGGGR